MERHEDMGDCQTGKSIELPVRFFDLSVRDLEFKRELLAAVEKVLDHGRLVLGPEVAAFEERVGSLVSAPFVVGVCSGTSALYLALRSLGIKQGDEVITTAMSWIATANAIALCGATPRFVDVDDDMNIDADKIREAISGRTRAIVPVH